MWMNGCDVPPTQRDDPPTRRGDHAWWASAQRLLLESCIHDPEEILLFGWF